MNRSIETTLQQQKNRSIQLPATLSTPFTKHWRQEMASSVHSDETLASAIEELKALIRSYDPNARFEVAAGPDAGDVYLIATVDTEDADDVMAIYIDRLVELQVDDRLPLYVLTLQVDKRTTNHRKGLGKRD